MSELERVDDAFQTEQMIIASVRRVRAEWAVLAHGLYRFVNEELWRDRDCNSFEEWLAGPEIGLGRRWVYQLVDTWRELHIKAQLPASDIAQLEPSKVQEILPAVRRGQVSLEQALADTQTLSQSDLRARYRDPQGRAPDVSTSYDPAREPEFATCAVCGSRYELRGNSLQNAG